MAFGYPIGRFTHLDRSLRNTFLSGSHFHNSQRSHWLCYGIDADACIIRIKNPRRAFLLIEWSFYLFVASTLIDLIYWCWTNPEFFNSVLGILLVLVRLIAAIIVLWWIGEVIYRVKNSYASPATYRTN
jgi:hypothetical protein